MPGCSDGALYKSTDGGATWTKNLFVDDSTGFTEVVMDPSNSSVLYAASYQRRRTSCCYNGGGPGSAMWKTSDAGKHWSKITGGGLPPGEYGRIAIDISRSNPNIVYAQVEAGDAHLVYPPGTPKIRSNDQRGNRVRTRSRDRKSTRLNSSHLSVSRMPSSA